MYKHSLRLKSVSLTSPEDQVQANKTTPAGDRKQHARGQIQPSRGVTSSRANAPAVQNWAHSPAELIQCRWPHVLFTSKLETVFLRDSPAVQRFGLHTAGECGWAGGMGSISGWGTEIPQAACCLFLSHTTIQNLMATCGSWLQYWTEMTEYLRQCRKSCWTALE